MAILYYYYPLTLYYNVFRFVMLGGSAWRLNCFYCLVCFGCVFYFIATMSFAAGYFLIRFLLSAFPAYLRFPV